MPPISCLTFIPIDNSTNIVDRLKEDLAVSAMVIQCATLFLSGVSLIALISSGCFKTCSALFYFNVTIADAIMAFFGIGIATLSSCKWSIYREFTWIFYVLRLVAKILHC